MRLRLGSKRLDRLECFVQGLSAFRIRPRSALCGLVDKFSPNSVVACLLGTQGVGVEKLRKGKAIGSRPNSKCQGGSVVSPSSFPSNGPKAKCIADEGQDRSVIFSQGKAEPCSWATVVLGGIVAIETPFPVSKPSEPVPKGRVYAGKQRLFNELRAANRAESLISCISSGLKLYAAPFAYAWDTAYRMPSVALTLIAAPAAISPPP